jgi:hypothetical protein
MNTNASLTDGYFIAAASYCSNVKKSLTVPPENIQPRYKSIFAGNSRDGF